jgi:hypothetical protein
MLASMLIGPAWPAAVPTITPDSVASSKELDYGSTVVAGGASYSGAVPTPSGDLPTGATVQQLVALQAFRCSKDTVPTSGTVPLDHDTRVDLTSRTTGSATAPQVTWTAPASGQWLLIGYWLRPTGQSLDGGQAYVVDHYSKRGAAAVSDFWDDTILISRVRRLARKVQASIFEDSIELSAGTHWTAALLSEFKKRRGYDLTPYLPVVLAGKSSGFGQTAAAPYSFEDSIDSRVQQDYHQTLSDLYLENHTWQIQSWAHARGLKYKAQAYGGQLDTTLAMATIDLPEGESLDDGKHSEKWRVITGGAHLGGCNIVSAEADATLNNAYGLTWAEDMLPMSNGNFASGVNRDIMHGYPTWAGPTAVWPGNDAFAGTTVGENWGPRMPTWTHIKDMSGYLSRCQYVVQQGVAKVDVAVYRPGLDIGYGSAQSGIGMWTDESLAAAGYTYDYQSAGSLALPAAKVRNGVLAPSGPGYRALVLFDQSTLSLATARRLLTFAGAGLPIVIAGDLPATTPGYVDPTGEDKKLAALLATLLKLRTVRRADDEAAVPGVLRSLGVRPAAEPATANADLATVRRALDGSDVYFLANVGDTALADSVALSGEGRPYLLDAHTGEITPIAEYTSAEGSVTVSVALQPGDATIVALGSAKAVGASAPGLSARSSGGELHYTNGTLTLRATTASSYSTVLSSGAKVTTRVSAVPAPVELTAWKLSVTDWQPGATPQETDTSTVHTLTLNGLKAWDAIEGLEDVSGIGTYTTTFTVPAAGSATVGAVLDLGEVFDTFRVWLNGTQLPAQNIIDTRVDLGPYLKKGSNKLTVEVATTLRNRLRVSRGGQWANLSRQSYGLVGPVTLTPYVDTPLASR